PPRAIPPPSRAPRPYGENASRGPSRRPARARGRGRARRSAAGARVRRRAGGRAPGEGPDGGAPARAAPLRAGGDLQRELGVDDRAVKALAADLYTEERRARLGRGLDALVLRVRDLPRAREAALFLAADVDLAWRLFALGLLAEEVAG